MTEAIKTIENIVTINDGRVVTDSLKVAEVFGKRHSDILKAIRSLNIPEDFKQRNFALLERTLKNSLEKEVTYPVFMMSRDGFTILAMGFTSKKAMQFKLAYIDAFNKMQRKLAMAQSTPTAASVPAVPTSSVISMYQEKINEAVINLAKNIGVEDRNRFANWIRERGITDPAESHKIVDDVMGTGHNRLSAPGQGCTSLTSYGDGAVHPSTIARAMANLFRKFTS